MKKVLVGCGILVLLLIGCGVAGFVILYHYGKGIAESTRKVADDFNQSNVDFPFSPTESMVLTGDRLDRWLNVRRAMLPEVAAFKEKAGIGAKPNPVKVMSALLNMSGEFGDAQFKALESQKMSEAEYAWIARQVYTALESGEALKDPDLKEIAASIDESEQSAGPNRGNQRNVSALHVPMTFEQINAALSEIKKHKQDMLDTKEVVRADVILIPMTEGSRSRVQVQDRVSSAALTVDGPSSISVPAAAR